MSSVGLKSHLRVKGPTLRVTMAGGRTQIPHKGNSRKGVTATIVAKPGIGKMNAGLLRGEKAPPSGILRYCLRREF